MNFNFSSPAEYAEAISNTVTAKNAMAKITPEQRELFMRDIKDEFTKRMGPEVMDNRSFEVMIITAVKA